MMSVWRIPRTAGEALQLMTAVALLSCTAVIVLFSVVYPQAAREGGAIFLSGWLSFSRYAATQLTLEWNAIGMALICAAIALGALHFLGRRLSPKSQWTWRSTVSIGLAVCWLFIVAMMSGGIGRSLYALTFAPEGNVAAQTQRVENLP